jgi:hypothetical protein
MRVANVALSTLSGIDVQVTNDVTLCVLEAVCPLEDGTSCGDADGKEAEYTTSFGCNSFRVFGCNSLKRRKRLNTSSNDSGNDFMIQKIP